MGVCPGVAVRYPLSRRDLFFLGLGTAGASVLRGQTRRDGGACISRLGNVHCLPSRNLAAYYHCHQGVSANTVYDLSPNGNNVALTGSSGSAFSWGKSGLFLNGTTGQSANNLGLTGDLDMSYVFALRVTNPATDGANCIASYGDYSIFMNWSLAKTFAFFTGGTTYVQSPQNTDPIWNRTRIYVVTKKPGALNTTNVLLYLDGTRVTGTLTGTQSTFNAANGKLLLPDWSGQPGNYPYSGGTLEALAMYSASLTDAQVTQIVTALRQSIVTLRTPLIVFEGDSITAGSVGITVQQAYPYVCMNGKLNPFLNNAVGGSIYADLTSRAAALDARYDPNRAGNYLCVMCGFNDMSGSHNISGTTTEANLRTYCLARKAAGWKVVVATLTASSESPGERDTFNSLVRANWTGYADALADVAADSVMGCTGCQNNGTYYQDGVHPTAAGEALVAPYFTAALRSLGAIVQ